MLHHFSKIVMMIAVVGLGLSGCQKHKTADQIKVGTISGPETQLMVTAKKVAKERYGLDIQIIEFNDYMQPNIALNDKDIDANACVTMPYLQEILKNKDFKIVPVAKTFIYPIGVYSNKLKDIKALPDNAVVAISNDPSNEARGLLLLQQAGFITLKPGVSFTATPRDIIKNDKHLTFRELDAAQLPRALPDVDIAIINTNYATTAGLDPNKDAIYREDNASPYYNVINAREDNKNSTKIKNLISAYQSPEVIATAQKIFGSNAIPAW